MGDWIDIFVDSETIRKDGEPLAWRMPDEIPPFEEWSATAMANAPRIPERDDIKLGNRKKPETVKLYQDGVIAEATVKRQNFAKTLETQYSDALADRNRQVEREWEATSLEAFLGGRVECIGVAVESNPVKVIRGASEAETLAIFWKGLAHHRKRGRIRVHAFGGFGFDFTFFSRRAQHLAGVGPPDLDHGALLNIAGFFYHTRASWKTKHLSDPRTIWLAGRSPFAKIDGLGKLGTVAEFYGCEIPEGYHDLDHSKTHELWVNGDTETLDRMVTMDTDLLRQVVRHQQACNLGED